MASKINGDGLGLPTTTVAGLSASAPAGSMSYVSDDNGNLWYKNASGWKSITSPLGSAANPANSAADIIAAGDSVGDGFYYIVINGTTRQVWCDMTNDGGGWMMAARLHTDNSQWTYDNSIWTNTTLLNETQGYDYGGHVKNWVYTQFAFSEVRIAMQTLSNGIVEPTWSNATSFASFMGSSTSSSNSRTTWINWVETAWGSYGQSWLANCNQYGTSKAYNYQYVKLGGTINGENDCSSNDESLGFGLKGISPYSNNISSGTYSPYGKSSGNRVGWIFLR